MKEVINKLEDLSKPKLFGLIAGSFLLVGGLFWFIFLKAIYEEKSTLSGEISNLKNEILKEENISKNLKLYKKEFGELEKKLELVMLELPDKKEIENFLESISLLATDNGLEVIKFAPRSTTIKDFYAEVPANIELQGTFHQVATFFDEVAHLPRIINIKNISASIVKELNKDVIIRVICRAVTFRYLDEEEQELVRKRKKKRKKRKRR